jgi:CPA1 family monovalent cation:H+ antiporter
VVGLYPPWRGAEGWAKGEARRLRKADIAERELRLAALLGQREAIFNLGRQHRISDEVSRRLVREIDLQEARYH